MYNLTMIKAMMEAQGNSIYQLIKDGVDTHQVMVLDEPMGGRIGPTKKALEDQGYAVDVWHVALEEEIPTDVDAIIISEPDRVWHNPTSVHMIEEFLKQTDKKIVMIPSRSRQEQRQNSYGISVPEQGFWKWAASRFPIM